MSYRFNHLAIAVPDLNQAISLYRDVIGATVSDPLDLPDHGVTTVFVTLENTKIELLYPLGDNSPIAHFLEKNPQGGIHHFCLETKDIEKSKDNFEAAGIRVLKNKEGECIKKGAHGKPVFFLHPKDCLGCLVEWEEK